MTTEKAESPKLPAALVKAQSEVKAALKGSTNAHHGYRYASAEEVLTVGRDALNDNALTLSPVSELFAPLPGLPGEAEAGGAVYLLHTVYQLQHESGEARTIETHVPICPERAKSGGWARPLDKALFGARTEALGYLLRDLLLIPRVDAPDVSGRGDRGEAPPRAAARQPERAKPAPMSPAMVEQMALAAGSVPALVARLATATAEDVSAAWGIASTIENAADRAEIRGAAIDRKLALAATVEEVDRAAGAIVKAGLAADRADYLTKRAAEKRIALKAQTERTAA